ncbi:MAG: Acetyl-CoA acetyltransferase [Promethearchaeota archaeon]|nr:MAG: Acetyl-CoA acetyltransferase [Candidatus Lokiarchaeota archaeon]
MEKKISPVIIGASQFTQDKELTPRLDPVGLMEKVCEDLFSNLDNKIRTIIDGVYMVNINSWSYEDAPERLSKKLGIAPKEKVYLPDGGDTPQKLANRASKAISSGKREAILIIGAESAYSVYQAKKGNLQLNWPEKKKPTYMEGELWNGINDFENKYKLIVPAYTYALFETALRALKGRSIEEHQRIIGELFAKFSKIASEHPYAWNNNSYTANEIITPSKKNRLVAHPYTKRMCSNMFVDQAACILMTSEEVAMELKVDENSWVYLMGGSDLKDIHEITRRPSLTNSLPVKMGVEIALKQAGLTIDKIDTFDIYSCFPSIVEIIVEELGLTLNDSRDFTITGGLPYFGGPWSNYSLHAIVTAVHRIQEDPSLNIMVVANGGYNTKKSIGVYGKNPPKISWNRRDDSEIQQKILSRGLEEPVQKAEGLISVDAYTIPYDREGKPKNFILLGTLENGRRTLAYLLSDSKELKNLQEKILVGKKFKVNYIPKKDINMIKL